MVRKAKVEQGSRAAQIIVPLGFLALAAMAATLWYVNTRQAAQQASAPARLTSFVADDASIIDRDTRMAMEAKLKAFDAEGGPQLVVATRYAVDRPVEEEAIRLARAWHIGRAGKNNGVLLLLVAHDRRARIEVGYGLEGVLTDALSRIIVLNEIDPALRDGDFTAAARKGMDAILATIHPEPIVMPEPKGPGLADRLVPAFFMLIVVLIGIGIVQWLALAIPPLRKHIERSRHFGWFARWRILGGSGGGGSGSCGVGGGGGSVGGGGSFGGGGAE